jgi:hypothetical protein
MPLSIMPLSIMPLSIMPLSIMPLSIMYIIATLNEMILDISDVVKKVMLCVTFY